MPNGLATSCRPQRTPGVSTAGRWLVNHQVRWPAAGSRRSAPPTAAEQLHAEDLPWRLRSGRGQFIQTSGPRVFPSLAQPRRGSPSRRPEVGWGGLAGGPARTPGPITVLSPSGYAGSAGAAAWSPSRSPRGSRGLPVTGHLRARPGGKGHPPDPVSASPRHGGAHPALQHTTARRSCRGADHRRPRRGPRGGAHQRRCSPRVKLSGTRKRLSLRRLSRRPWGGRRSRGTHPSRWFPRGNLQMVGCQTLAGPACASSTG